MKSDSKASAIAVSNPDRQFLLRVLAGLLISTAVTGGIACSLAMRVLNEPSIQIALN